MSLYARSHDCPTCTCANPLSEPIIDQIVGGEFTSMVNRLGADVREKALIARIEKLEAAIRECMNREGFDDTQEAFDAEPLAMTDTRELIDQSEIIGFRRAIEKSPFYDEGELRRVALFVCDEVEKISKRRIKKLEAAIRECMIDEGYSDTDIVFEHWIEEHQPFEARTVKK